MKRYSLIIEFTKGSSKDRIWITDHCTMQDVIRFTNNLIDHTVYSAGIRDNITEKTVKWLKEPL